MDYPKIILIFDIANALYAIPYAGAYNDNSYDTLAVTHAHAHAYFINARTRIRTRTHAHIHELYISYKE